jgi:hypothetical protein
MFLLDAEDALTLNNAGEAVIRGRAVGYESSSSHENESSIMMNRL